MADAFHKVCAVRTPAGEAPYAPSEASVGDLAGDGEPAQTLADYAEAVRQTGVEENVPVIDLNAARLQPGAAPGSARSKNAFVFYPANSFQGRPEAIADNTHHSSYGAYELARVVATGIQSAKLDIARLLADDFTAFDPSQPDDVNTLVLPLSPMPANAAVKSEGS